MEAGDGGWSEAQFPPRSPELTSRRRISAPRRLTLLALLLALATAVWLSRITRPAGGRGEATDPEVAHGLALLNGGDVKGAAAVLEGVARHRPNDAEAAYLLGMACFRAGELGPAAAALQRSVALRPEFAEGHRRLGQVYTMAREYALAAASLERARALAPEDPTTLIQLGRLYLTTAEPSHAEAALGEAIRRRPDSAAAHALLGEAWRQEGMAHWPAAAREFRRTLELDPANPDAHYRLGWLALQAGRPAEALPHLRQAVQSDPQLAGAWYLRGQAARRLGRHDEAHHAFEAFRRCRARSPEDAGA
jgi:tetratricopeptide (TPR) repeat protein